MNEPDYKTPWQNETITDQPKDERSELIKGLIAHAAEDMRLAELTASRESYWISAEDCRNARIALEKLLASYSV